MASFSEYKETVQERAKQLAQKKKTLEKQKEKISKKEQKAREQRGKLQQAKEALPDVRSQQALRGQKYGKGLKGRKVRRQTFEQEEKIGERKNVLGKYLGRIKEYRKEKLKPREEAISKAQGKVKKAQKDIKAYETARDLFSEERPLIAHQLGGKVKDYYEKFASKERAIRDEQIQKIKDDPLKEFAGFKDGKIAFYEKKKGKTQFQKELEQTKSGNFDIAAGLPRKEKNEVTSKTPNFNLGIIPLVSARDSQKEVKKRGSIILRPSEVTPSERVEASVSEDASIIERGISAIERAQSKRDTANIRGKGFDAKTAILGGAPGTAIKNVFLEPLEFTREAVTSPKETARNVRSSADFLVKGATQPDSFERLKLNQMRKNWGTTLRNKPLGTAATIAGDIALGTAAYRGVSKLSRGLGKAASKLSPSYRKTAQGTIKLSDEPGDYLRVTEDVTEPVSRQISRSGGDVKPTSAARDFFGRFSGARRVRKTIKGEEKLTPETKRLLNQYDEGTLPRSRLSELNRRIKSETKSKGLLERSYFADPEGRLRPSRLGVQEQERASLLDVLSGDATLRRGRPQALYFGKQTAEKIPESLKPIMRKINKGESLNPSEESRLLSWQSQQTGQFKPLGFQTAESELTAAPGEIIKKGDRYFTYINGRKVNIYRATLGKGSDKVEDVIKKINRGEDLTPDEARTFNQETGFDYYSDIQKTPYYSPLKGASQGTFGIFSSGSVSSITSKPQKSSPISSSSSFLSSGTSGGGKTSLSTSGGSGTSKSVSEGFSFVSYSPKGGSSTKGGSGTGGFSSGSLGGGSGFGGSSPAGGSSTPKPPAKRPQRSKSQPRKQEGREGEFDVYTRKFGEDKQIGTAKNKPSAKQLLRKYLDQTLRASGYVERGGKKVPLDMGRGYRKSKQDPLRVVEKRSRRLKSQSEINEIQAFKSGSKKRTRKKSGFNPMKGSGGFSPFGSKRKGKRKKKGFDLI